MGPLLAICRLLAVIPDLCAAGTSIVVPVWTKVSGGDAIAARRGFPPTCSAIEG